MRLEKRAEKEVDMPKIIPFDTLAYAKELESAGIKSEHAEAHAKVLAEVLETGFSTKQDSHSEINKLSRDIAVEFAEVNTKFDTKFAEVNAKFAEVNTKFDTKFAKVDMEFSRLSAEIANMKIDIIKWVIGITFGQLAIIFPVMFAMIKYLH